MKMKDIPRLHSSLLEPVMGKSITKKEYRQAIGSRSHLSRESIDVLAKDAKDLGLLKQEGVFGRMEFSKPVTKKKT